MWSINGITQTLSVEQKNQVLIDTCTQLGFDIPRFCYHENLKIAGNCRMCLIEDSKAPKPVICCAGNPAADLNIFTNTVQVKKSREAVMEFLLINHPLDCPICDQGGECDLQDLALVYGADHGRFYDYKRNVEDKNCGPVVKTVMNRCILCTRCVRFSTDVAGLEILGMTGRGGKMEIGSYVEKLLDSDLSGNLIDVCPVGALTSKPYSFSSRPWEIKKVNLFSLVDDQPQFIRADIKENEIVRFLPAKNSVGANIWITNRTRFSYEGLTRSRLLEPSIFGTEVNWFMILNSFKKVLLKTLSTINLKQKNLLDISFADISNYDYFDLRAIKEVLMFSGLPVATNTSNSKLLPFTFLPRIFNLEQNLDNVVLVNLNLGFELPVTGLLLQQRLTVSENTPFILKWRAVTTPILKSFELTLAPSAENIFNFFGGKTWFNSLFNLNAQISTLCLYTLEWDKILQILKFSFFKTLTLFLFFPTASYRTLVDINLFWKDLLFGQSAGKNFSLINWGFGNALNNDSNYSSSMEVKHITHKTDFLFNSAFFLPSKLYIENNSIFYNLDYTYFKSYKALSSSTSCKSIKSFVQVLLKLLNLKNTSLKMYPLQFLGNKFWPLNFRKNNLNYFFSLNSIFKKKLLSKANFYQMYPILTYSPTLAALQRSSFNLNIY